jgi:hypothetical protein
MARLIAELGHVFVVEFQLEIATLLDDPLFSFVWNVLASCP